MNKRIQELLEQAGGGYFDEDGNALSAALIGKDVERFAELIVRECMDAVGDGPMQRPEIQRIKAKFGVEYYEPIEKAFRS
jgi:hypothetical protein